MICPICEQEVGLEGERLSAHRIKQYVCRKTTESLCPGSGVLVEKDSVGAWHDCYSKESYDSDHDFSMNG